MSAREWARQRTYGELTSLRYFSACLITNLFSNSLAFCFHSLLQKIYTKMIQKYCAILFVCVDQFLHFILILRNPKIYSPKSMSDSKNQQQNEKRKNKPYRNVFACKVCTDAAYLYGDEQSQQKFHNFKPEIKFEEKKLVSITIFFRWHHRMCRKCVLLLLLSKTLNWYQVQCVSVFFSDVFDDASEFQIELKAHDKRFEKRKTFLAT